MRLVRLFAAASLCAVMLAAPAGARAQGYGDYYVTRPQGFLGGSVGASVFSDSSGTTAAWLNSAYSSSVSLAAGDYITSVGSQDTSAFGAKIYGGIWFTPNFGIEGGLADLGRIHWTVNSYNTTGSFNVTDAGSVEPTTLYGAFLVGADAGGMRFFGKAGIYEAFSYFNANSFDNNSGAYFGASRTIDNTGALLGLGMSVPFGYHGAWRIELEDYLNVGANNTTDIPPWRGNVLLISTGYTFLF